MNRKKPLPKDQPPEYQKQFTRKQYLIKKMGKTPVKSQGFQSIQPLLKASLLKDPLSLSKSAFFFKPTPNPSFISKYAAKNGSIVQLGTTGVENEEEPIVLMEEELFLENSLQSTKALMNYDCWDEDFEPMEWLKRCKGQPLPHAKSPIYVNKRYLWAGVEILGWNHELQKFIVKILINGNQKLVSRLSLMFLNEDHAKFMERVQVCKQRQQRAEDEIRFFKYVEEKSDDLVSSLDADTRRNILMKTKKRKMEEENQIVGRLIDSLMSQVNLRFLKLLKFLIFFFSFF